MECLSSLVGVKELCESGQSPAPLFYLDDAEGVNRATLSQLAQEVTPSGLKFGTDLIESASRFLMADIETLIPKGYSIKAALNSFCNTCTYSALSSGSSNTGVVIKNISTSTNGYLSLDSLKVMIASSGTYTIVLDDGVAPKSISHTFTSGTEVILTNINFKTSSRYIKVYFAEPGVNVTALNCPTKKSCGCSGSTKESRDITITGLLGGVEFTTQYGFIPCASVVCSLDNILCSIINQQPKLFALALFYRATARYFSEYGVTQRNNRNASFDEEEKLTLSDRYMELYYERLRGSRNVKGIADNMAAALNNLGDSCVECNRQTSTAWAVG